MSASQILPMIANKSVLTLSGPILVSAILDIDWLIMEVFVSVSSALAMSLIIVNLVMIFPQISMSAVRTPTSVNKLAGIHVALSLVFATSDTLFPAMDLAA